MANSPHAEKLTYDALFGGKVRFWQPARGYRVNIDAVLLAGFAAPRLGRRLLDLGSGVGAVTLAVHHLRPAERATLIECEADLAALARKNLAHCGLDAEVIVTDLERQGLPEHLHGQADLVVVNPPFFEPGAARQAAHDRNRRARSGRLDPFLTAAGLALSGKRACACFAYPARSLEHLLQCAQRQGLVAKRLRLVHADRDQPARLCLLELRRAKAGGLVVEAPLYEWQAIQVRSPELLALTSADAAISPPLGRQGRVSDRS
jgi:tRNA1(Val) A37 N6-methylase TrmN6